MMTGKIKKLIYLRGFGFIESPERGDLFFHCSQVEDVGFEDLKESDIVTYEIAKGPTINVQRIEGG
ncbi:cold shock domain-containing protein [bacterium]|nr:cold shock domain-containing protein [bacterium]